MPGPIGLTEVPTQGLRALLAHVHRGEVGLPLTIRELTRTGLQYCAVELLGQLRTLDRAGVVAVLVTVIAEREAAEERLRRMKAAAVREGMFLANEAAEREAEALADAAKAETGDDDSAFSGPR